MMNETNFIGSGIMTRYNYPLRIIECMQCGDTFEHISNTRKDKKYCEHCLIIKNKERARRYRHEKSNSR